MSSVTPRLKNLRGKEAKKIERIHATLFAELLGKTMNGSFTAFWRKVLPSEAPIKCWNAGVEGPPFSNCLQEMPTGSLIESWHSDKTHLNREESIAGEGVWPECLNCAAESRVAELFEDFESAVPHRNGMTDLGAFVGGYLSAKDLIELETIGEAEYNTFSLPGLEANAKYAGSSQDFSVVLERLESEWGDEDKDLPPGPSLLDICHYILQNEYKIERIQRENSDLWDYQQGEEVPCEIDVEKADCWKVAQWLRACREREDKVVRSYLLDLNLWDKGVAHFFAIIAKEFHPDSRLSTALEIIATAPLRGVSEIPSRP